MKRYIAPILALLLYIPHVGDFFLSDDFNILLRGRNCGFFELLTRGDGQFFRPFVHIFFKLFDVLFGLNPLPYHLFVFVIFAVTVYLVYILARKLELSENAALFGSLFFALHFVHLEPVIWLASASDIFMTLFGLLFLLQLRAERIWASSIFLGLALLSKESGAFLLLLIPFFTRDKRALFLLIPLAAYTALRLPGMLAETGDSYSIAVGLNTMKNLGFFTTALFFPLDFHSLAAGGLSGMPLYAIAAVIVSFVLYGLLVIKGITRRFALMAIAVFLPFLLVNGSGYRFLLFPSIFFCIALGQLLAERKKGIWIAAIPIFILLLVINIRAGRYWSTGSEITASTSRTIEESPADCFRVSEPPDNFHGAYVFRNGLESLAALHGKYIGTDSDCTELIFLSP